MEQSKMHHDYRNAKIAIQFIHFQLIISIAI